MFGITAGYLLLAERLSLRQWIGAVVLVAVVGAAAIMRRAPSPLITPPVG